MHWSEMGYVFSKYSYFHFIIQGVLQKNIFKLKCTYSKKHGAVVEWLSLLHNVIQLNSLNSGSAQVQILLAACRRLAMVTMSDNGPGWK